MGYTHYWYISYGNESLDLKKFKVFSNYVRELILTTNIKICDGGGTGLPRINSSCVRFNGCRCNGEDYETFEILRPAQINTYRSSEDFFNFCKTARRPYDDLVVAALLLFKDTFMEQVTISSDGDFDEWAAGYELARSVCKDLQPLRELRT